MGGSHFSTFFIVLACFLCHCCISTEAATSIHVGVILDMQSSIGNLSQSCISLAAEDFYAVNDHYVTRLIFHPKDAEDVLSAGLAAMKLLDDEEVQVIVGPQRSEQVEVVAGLGKKAQVPVVSFSATSPSISRSQMPYFIRMTQNDTYQLEAIAAIVRKYKWKEVVLIYEDTDYGNGIIPYLIDLFQGINVRIPHKIVIPHLAREDQILEQLETLLATQTRVFIVHLSASLGPLFFLKVEEVGLMSEGTAWIITEELTSLLGSMNSSVIDSMLGVIGIKAYIPRSRELDKFRARLIRKFVIETAALDELNSFCIHAHDIIWAVAMAAERLGTNRSFEKAKKYNKSDELLEAGISEIGPLFLKEILNSKFRGLSGDIVLVDGQLQPGVFEIINVVGPGAMQIGFWIPNIGLSQKPDATSVVSTNNLGPAIWPGKSTTVPKGRKLKIAYPVKISFSEVANYSIEVFAAVMDTLEYGVAYDLVGFETANGEIACSYNDLVHQVFLQKYDAAVGDITITANRSLLVDFAHPFTTGGVAMVILQRSVWQIFLLPFSKYVGPVYLALCTFIFVLVIWCLENWPISAVGVNQIAQIPIIAGKLLLSALFTSEINVVRPWSRSVAVIFCIVFPLYMALFGGHIIILEDSGQLMDVDVKDVLESGEFVGYPKRSFVVETLLRQQNFDESKLRAYNSREEYAEALDKGSQNGGVAAIFDEIPYVKLFLNKYCGKYRMVGPTFRTEGFGFVFRTGSPLVPDINRAILSVIEGENILPIEEKWLGRERKCVYLPDEDESSYNTITLTLPKMGGVKIGVSNIGKGFGNGMWGWKSQGS